MTGALAFGSCALNLPFGLKRGIQELVQFGVPSTSGAPKGGHSPRDRRNLAVFREDLKSTGTSSHPRGRPSLRGLWLRGSSKNR